MDELMQLKKTMSKSVCDYSREFRTLLRMIPFLEHGENEAVPEADVVRMYKMGMPINWQVELHRISRGWDLPSMEAQFELIERNEKESELLRGNRNRNKEQQPQQRSNAKKGNNQGPKNDNQGRANKYCGYCKRNNHNNNECFRDPSSPAYRPRNNSGGGQQPHRHHQPAQSFNGNRRANNSMAAMQEQMEEMAAMMRTLNQRQDDEYAAAQFYETPRHDSMASMEDMAAMTTESAPRMEIEVQIGPVRLTALLDTGCTNSAIDKQTLQSLGDEVVLERENAKFRKADNTVGQTTHRASTTLKLLAFSNTRSCTHSFRVADTLLYPVMLGKDFMWQQRMMIDFEDCTLKAEIAVDEPKKKEPLEGLIATRSLTAEQMETILTLVNKFPELFSGKLGTFRKEPYVIPLKPDAEPYAGKPFPIPMAYFGATRAEIELFSEIEGLVAFGVLTPDSSSEWAAPAFVIPKKDGTMRLVCDFRQLNKRLRRSYYPVRSVPEMIRSVSKPVYISSFDVPLSYYTRLLAKHNRDATAIVVAGLGKFVFNRLPMGVSTAPDEFQASMDELLGDLPYVRVYLDDILVLSESFEEHMEHLRVVKDGIEAIPNKVSAIMDIAPPRHRKDLRRFVGMVNYYRDMFPRRAELFSPLTALLSPAKPFTWSPQLQTAFEAVKAALAATVRLAFPESGKPFQVYTDASQLQLGAVIMQHQRPLVFWSKKCNSAQSLYPANRLELLSIVLLLREFRSLLLGQELHLFTDHLNLTYSTFHDVHMMRWRLEIEEFGPNFHYVPGQVNVVADALSRLPRVTKAATELEERTVDTGCKPSNQDDVANAIPGAAAMNADEDELFNFDMRTLAMEQQKDNTLPKTCQRELGGVQLWVDPQSHKVIVPMGIQSKLLATYHEWLIHPGASTMKNTISQVFTWSTLESDTTKLVDACLACSKAKHPTVRYGKLPAKKAIAWPWYEIAVDSIGPYGKQKFRALTIIDTSTRLIEILPALDGTSAEAAYLLDRHWLNRYPRPMRCIFDAGSEFKKEFQELLDSYGIEHAPTTVRNPQANAVIERVHRVIGDKLRTKTLQTAADWKQFLNNTTFALRSAHHSMMNASPAQRAFGRDIAADWKQFLNNTTFALRAAHHSMMNASPAQ
ncbi:Pol Polyprotein [Phytophthora megakarya]|uniref:Pol Polyprotein n=1 Tax=Phytophthora megakarya TaxID=4795 RepID=A0A225WED9_9STRA|nr:Pol Polyprotein [Phytophthora megakarya]